MKLHLFRVTTAATGSVTVRAFTHTDALSIAQSHSDRALVNPICQRITD